MAALIEVENLVKVYEMDHTGVHALRGVSFLVNPGEFIAITGPSGSGKSTLLHILSCLDSPTSGVYRFGGHEVSRMSRGEQAKLRNQTFGFVFQNFNLLPRMNVIENVELPLIYAGVKGSERERQAREVVAKLGLSDFALHEPNQLSGGQQQRVAIARALVMHPAVIFADEPTGNLDTQTSLEVMSILESLNQKERLTIVLVTHEPDIVRFARRQLILRDGKIEGHIT